MSDSTIYWCPERNRLVFLSEKATPDFWDGQWESDDWVNQITRSRNSKYWHQILDKYLPDKNSRILEGGCGDGHLVDAVDFWGYNSIGVDYALDTVKKINENAPNLDVRYGDVGKLDFPDKYFDGYFSLGVIEHFWDGYDQILSEMYRVVNDNGYVFLSFPCMSMRDRIRLFFNGIKELGDEEMPSNFYQFALSPKSIKRDFREAGFQLVEEWRIDGLLGMTRYSKGKLKHLREFLIEQREKSLLAKLFTAALNRGLAKYCGHSAFLVFKK